MTNLNVNILGIVALSALAGCGRFTPQGVHFQAPQAPPAKMKITLSSSKTNGTYYKYEPILLDVQYKNIGTTSIDGQAYFGDLMGEYDFFVQNGLSVAPASAYTRYLQEREREASKSNVHSVQSDMRINWSLKPGEAYTERVVLQHYVDLAAYTYTGLSIKLTRFGVQSNLLNLKVKGEPFDLGDIQVSSGLYKNRRLYKQPPPHTPTVPK